MVKTRQQIISGINDDLNISGRIRRIKNVGETKGVDLIIKSDRKDYYGLGGSIGNFYSITNISGKDQNVKILNAYSSEIKRTVKARLYVNNTTEKKEVIEYDKLDIERKNPKKILRNVITTNWEDKELIDKDGIKDPKITLLRKGLHGRHHKKQFSDFIKAGETKYYKVSIGYPSSVQNDEFIIEAFGDKGGYGYLDPNLWTYEALFNTDLYTGGGADLNGQNNWLADACYNVDDNITIEGDGNVQFSCGDDNEALVDIGTAVESGTMYFSFQANATNVYYFIYLRNSLANNEVTIFISNDGKFYTDWDGAWNELGSYAADTIYRVGIQFRCVGAAAYEGLDEAKYNVSVDDAAFTGPYSFDTGASSDMESIRIYSGTDNTAKIMYFDFISPNYSAIVVPTVTTKAATDVTHNSATGNGNITDVGGENCDKRGIVYSKTSRGDPGNTAPDVSDYEDYEEEEGDFGTGAFTRSLTGLDPETKYYARAYAHNSEGYSYGVEIDFTTSAAPPTTSPNRTSKKNYTGQLAFIQQFIKHRRNDTTPWAHPDGYLI